MSRLHVSFANALRRPLSIIVALCAVTAQAASLAAPTVSASSITATTAVILIHNNAGSAASGLTLTVTASGRTVASATLSVSASSYGLTGLSASTSYAIAAAAVPVVRGSAALTAAATFKTAAPTVLATPVITLVAPNQGTVSIMIAKPASVTGIQLIEFDIVGLQGLVQSKGISPGSTSVTFVGLNPGTYGVSVAALPVSGAYAESNTAFQTFTIALPRLAVTSVGGLTNGIVANGYSSGQPPEIAHIVSNHGRGMLVANFVTSSSVGGSTAHPVVLKSQWVLDGTGFDSSCVARLYVSGNQTPTTASPAMTIPLSIDSVSGSELHVSPVLNYPGGQRWYDGALVLQISRSDGSVATMTVGNPLGGVLGLEIALNWWLGGQCTWGAGDWIVGFVQGGGHFSLPDTWAGAKWSALGATYMPTVPSVVHFSAGPDADHYAVITGYTKVASASGTASYQVTLRDYNWALDEGLSVRSVLVTVNLKSGAVSFAPTTSTTAYKAVGVLTQ